MSITRFAAYIALAFSLLISAQANAASYKIGISVPLSGNAANLARQFVAGARLAVRALASDDEVELVIADDGCDESLGELAGQDLADAQVSIVTGLLCNAAARAVAKEMQSTGIPIIAAGAQSNQLMRDAINEEWNLWRLSPGDDFAAKASFRLLSERWDGLPIGVIDDGTIYGRTMSDEFRALLEEAGRPAQFSDAIRPAQSTQAALIRRLRQSGVSAIFVVASAEDTALIWDSAKDLKEGFEMAGSETLALLPWLDIASTTADGLLAVMPPQPEELPAFKSLERQLKSSNIEPEAHVFQGYAAIEVAMAALRPTPEQTSEALEQTVFRTVLGNVDFDEERRNRVNNYILQQWRDKKFVPVQAETE
ncbi:MAG: branched-chain amino acid ABC transporter substrate-binding protein [Pseudomonadota bacterium]